VTYYVEHSIISINMKSWLAKCFNRKKNNFSNLYWKCFSLV